MAAVRATSGEAGEAGMADKLYERSVSFYPRPTSPGRSPRPTVAAMERTDPDLVADELTQITQYLDYHRATLAQKAGGLTRDQLGTKVGTSTLTLAGLVNHAALNEDHWFGVVLLGLARAEPWASVPWDDDPDWEFRTALDLEPAALLERYVETCDAQPRQHRRGRRRRRARLPLRSAPAAPRRAVQPPLDPAPHARGDRPAQRPRRPAPRGGRRRDRRVIPSLSLGPLTPGEG